MEILESELALGRSRPTARDAGRRNRIENKPESQCERLVRAIDARLWKE